MAASHGLRIFRTRESEFQRPCAAARNVPPSGNPFGFSTRKTDNRDTLDYASMKRRSDAKAQFVEALHGYFTARIFSGTAPIRESPSRFHWPPCHWKGRDDPHAGTVGAPARSISPIPSVATDRPFSGRIRFPEGRACAQKRNYSRRRKAGAFREGRPFPRRPQANLATAPANGAGVVMSWSFDSGEKSDLARTPSADP